MRNYGEFRGYYSVYRPAKYDTGTIPGVVITAGALTISSVSSLDNYAGSTTEYTVNFTAVHNIPIRTRLKLFCNDYDLTNATLSSPDGVLTRSAHTLSVSLNAGISALANVSLKFANYKPKICADDR